MGNAKQAPLPSSWAQRFRTGSLFGMHSQWFCCCRARFVGSFEADLVHRHLWHRPFGMASGSSCISQEHPITWHQVPPPTGKRLDSEASPGQAAVSKQVLSLGGEIRFFYKVLRLVGLQGGTGFLFRHERQWQGRFLPSQLGPFSSTGD